MVSSVVVDVVDAVDVVDVVDVVAVDSLVALLFRAINRLYSLCSLRYTLFHHAHTNGMPVMRALWMEFPTEEQLFDVDHTFMVGSSLMVSTDTFGDV